MTTTSTIPGFVPVAEVMSRFGIKRSAFYSWVRAGKLGAPVRIGRRTYLPVESVRRCEKWLRETSLRGQKV